MNARHMRGTGHRPGEQKGRLEMAIADPAGDPRVLTEKQRRTRNIETMRTWFRLQESHDVESWLTLWADEATQSVPFAPEGFPKRIEGKAELATLYRTLFKGFVEVNIRDLVIDALLDPDRVLVRWHTYAPLVNGDVYENDLVGIFEFDLDGRVRHLTEYLNPDRINISA
jgi:ketosteroid isomerase-like protein